jgi:hypothetical protein
MGRETLVLGRSGGCAGCSHHAVGEGAWLLRRDERFGLQRNFGGNTRGRAERGPDSRTRSLTEKPGEIAF